MATDPSEHVTEPPGVASLVRRVGVFSWSVIGLALFVALIGWLLIEGRIILAPLLVSVVFIFLLNPIVSYLKRRGVPRVVGTGIGFLILHIHPHQHQHARSDGADGFPFDHHGGFGYAL